MESKEPSPWEELKPDLNKRAQELREDETIKKSEKKKRKEDYQKYEVIDNILKEALEKDILSQHMTVGDVLDFVENEMRKLKEIDS